ncbi:ABC-2 type transport system ATP-binding protein [Streptomyces sp. DvalAA-14]|nr:ATP-binding cassette domain-containing protein [Streptomyces sp. SID4948]SCD99309.1 ABC-2 type transport system ATP-binding protein [Streptomyces sp. DvalAA-14]
MDLVSAVVPAEPPAHPKDGLTEPVLRIADVVKSYAGRTVVHGVSIEISAGECFGLLGPNGAGKTTTILTACGLLGPDSGEVTLGAERLPVALAAARRQIGYVPQDIALYDDLSGRENLIFFGNLYGLRRAALRKRIDEALDFVGLGDRGKDRVGTYSGGMKRRLNIAAALLHEPAVLILDEPTVGVDPQSRNAILEGLHELRVSGIAILYTSHYMDEIERICNRIGIMDEGRILAEGTREQLMKTLGAEVERVRLSCRGDASRAAAHLTALSCVVGVEVVDGALEVAVRGAAGSLPEVLTALARDGVDVTALSVDTPDLESVFLHLTGKALRDV